MQTLATVHETFYHLQYIYIFTQTLYIRTFSSLPKTPHQDLELNFCLTQKLLSYFVLSLRR